LANPYKKDTIILSYPTKKVNIHLPDFYGMLIVHVGNFAQPSQIAFFRHKLITNHVFYSFFDLFEKDPLETTVSRGS